MEGLKPVYWHQGLFLQPQHFQQSELYQRQLLNPLLHYMHPEFWGVCELQMQSNSLENRVCEVDSGSFLFPDGTYVSVPGDGVLASRNLESDWIEPDRPLTVYVGIRKLSRIADNVTVVSSVDESQSVLTRYMALANPQTVRDIYSEGPEAEVKSLIHVLKLVMENERDEYTDYQLIPIAQVIRDGDVIKYSPTFSPPAVTLKAAPFLARITKEVRDEITGRAIQLASYNKGAETGGRDFDPNLMRYKLALRSLSRYIPQLFHLTETEHVHPWDVYGVLRQLVGEVSTFTTLVNVLGETQTGERLVPTYNHTASGDCFASIRELVTRLLNEITIGPEFLVDMTFDEICYTADVPPEFFTKQVDFYIILKTVEPFNDHVSSLLTSAKLASREMVDTLVERSLPGIGMIHVPNAPAGLPSVPNTYYVRVDSHDELWSSIEREKNLSLLWQEAPGDLEVQLVIAGR